MTYNATAPQNCEWFVNQVVQEKSNVVKLGYEARESMGRMRSKQRAMLNEVWENSDSAKVLE